MCVESFIPDGSVFTSGGCAYPYSDNAAGDGSYWASAKSLADFLGVPYSQRGQLQASYNIMGGNAGASFFMDEQCRFVQSGGNTKVCGYAGISWSPISLVWEENSNLDENMTVARFSLTAEENKPYTLWKASHKAPLLVFNPNGSRGVTSATQLFGSVAFGGKTTTLSEFSDRAVRQPWRDGFEALGLLDVDGDGAIRGQELKQLELWFDANRDALVDSGELFPVETQGITSLFYRGAEKRAGSNDLELSVGYERMSDNGVIQGAAVDWYAPTFSSKVEALQALHAMMAPASGGSAKQMETNSHGAGWQDDPLSFVPRKSSDHIHDLSGYWLWHLEDDKGSRFPGLFALDQPSHFTLRGFSVIESKLKQNPTQLRSGILIFPIEGQWSQVSGGEPTVTFTVRDPASGIEARSVASLTQNGVVMRGETTQTFIEGDSSAPKRSASIRYRWVAQKFIDSPK
jgi:hypothetical protein